MQQNDAAHSNYNDNSIMKYIDTDYYHRTVYWNDAGHNDDDNGDGDDDSTGHIDGDDG